MYIKYRKELENMGGIVTFIPIILMIV
ncbi:preprotein translocase subunit YajC, partial [Listeria monocytogenes]|nr:preprotein translocase subunit YajC [Listeria monocytogenes]